LARNGSETVLTDEGGCDGGGSKSVAPGGRFLTVRWRNGKGVCGGGDEARSRAFFRGQGGEVEERSMVSLCQNRGRNGVWSTALGEEGEKGENPTTWVRHMEEGGGGRWPARHVTGRNGRQSVRHASRGGGVRARGPLWAGRRGFGPESSAPFFLFEKIQIDLIKQWPSHPPKKLE
jgi:hypothetical protein